MAVDRDTRAPVSFAGGSITYFGIFWPRFEPQKLQKSGFSFYISTGSSLQGYGFTVVLVSATAKGICKMVEAPV